MDEKEKAYIEALKTNRCADILKAYYDWRGQPQHVVWKDDAETQEEDDGKET